MGISINTRKVGDYVQVYITVDGVRHDLNLMDQDELKALAGDLGEVLDEVDLWIVLGEAK